MILEIVDSVLSESDLSAANQTSHQVFGFLAHVDIRGEVETILEKDKQILEKLQVTAKLKVHGILRALVKLGYKEFTFIKKKICVFLVPTDTLFHGYS